MSGSYDSPLESVVLDDVDFETIPTAEIRAALESDRSLVRQRGATVCGKLAADDPERVQSLVDPLGSALRDDNAGVVQTAASALTEIAAVEPDAVIAVVDDIATLTRSDRPDIHLVGAELLGTIARERPAECASAVEELLAGLGNSPSVPDDEAFAAHAGSAATERTLRQRRTENEEYGRQAHQTTANVVCAVAVDAPTAFADHVETVAALASADDLTARSAALDVLATLAEESPDLVQPVSDAAVTALDADVNVVRARAVRVLGYLGDEAHVDALERVAETDDDPEVASLAAETASFLDR